MITVFIIDQEPADRAAIRNCYDWEQNEFVFIGEAGSGTEALNKIKETAPDIVLTDVDLPDISGLELAKTILGQYPHCHIIIITHCDSFACVRTALRIGVDDFILKPLNAKESGDEFASALQRVKTSITEYRHRMLTEENTSSSPETAQQLMEFHHHNHYGKSNHLISLAVEYIEEHLTEPDLSLKKVAASIFTNESYLSRIFKQEIGISMIEYITRKRIAESIRLLNHTNLKVYEISEQVGFRDSHYFSICFKKHVGITVKEFKKQKRTDNRTV